MGRRPVGTKKTRRRRRPKMELEVDGELPARVGLYPGEREILLPHAQRLLTELLEELKDDDRKGTKA